MADHLTWSGAATDIDRNVSLGRNGLKQKRCGGFKKNRERHHLGNVSKCYVNMVRYGKRSEFKVDKGDVVFLSECVLARF